ncbi:MAG: DUF177 domain-containing protein [Anaerolineales bacterium]|nr:DUF177 domain-containing protein [Anaerolineales bacterium]
MNENMHAFRLQVGFLIHQTVGYRREFLFEFDALHIEPDLDLSNIRGSAQITRTPQGLLVQMKMEATSKGECVRCLDEISQPLEIDFTELYAFSPRSVTDSGLILAENGQIDLSPLVREYMLLEIPLNPICKAECKGLCPICGENLNESSHDHDDDIIDPRLAGLKKLLETD